MANEQAITLTIEIRELLTEFFPKMAKEYMTLRNVAQELEGTEFTVTIDISGTPYSYAIKDGLDFAVSQGALEKPMVFLAIELKDMEKLAQLKNIDMLLGMQDSLSRQKYDILKAMNGTASFDLEHEDGTKSLITAVFNGAQNPKATFLLSMENAKKLTTRQDNPVQLFMSGNLKIEGDMAFAMSTQPLFT